MTGSLRIFVLQNIYKYEQGIPGWIWRTGAHHGPAFCRMKAYGNAIVNEIKARVGRDVNLRRFMLAVSPGRQRVCKVQNGWLRPTFGVGDGNAFSPLPMRVWRHAPCGWKNRAWTSGNWFRNWKWSVCNKKNKRSPKFAFRFLEWFCPPLYEGIEGDLKEAFENDVQLDGIGRAKLRLTWNAIMFSGPAIILRNKFGIKLLNSMMLKIIPP